MSPPPLGLDQVDAALLTVRYAQVPVDGVTRVQTGRPRVEVREDMNW